MFSFIEQMEENTMFNLTFPFHINHDKLLGNDYYNPEYPDTYHGHSFEEVLEKAYREPKAFYLSEEDKEYYSKQEMTFIDKVIEDEIKKLDKGYKILTLNLTEETMGYIEEYKANKGMTFEESIINILEDMIKNPEYIKNHAVNIQEYLKENFNTETPYAIVTYVENEKEHSDLVYFVCYNDWYLEAPCCLISMPFKEDVESFCNHYVNDVIELEDNSEKSKREYIEKYIRPMIRNNTYYEIDCPQTGPFLPKQVKSIKLISETEALDFILKK